MSALAALTVSASGVQGGGAHPATAGTLFAAVLILVLTALAGLLFVWARRRRRREQPVGDQWRALAVMGELCPNGWQAQITLYGWGAPVPSDAPPSRVPLVEVEWKQFAEQPGRVAVARRTWAKTIPEALEAMVEDRRTDVTLEQIEQEAGGEELWEA